MKILVTGSKGFIGSRLVLELRRLGNEVFEFDKGDSYPENGVDIVYHLASNVNAYDSVDHPLQAKENIDLIFDVLEWMRSTKSPKIVFASSREVYSLENPYGVSKFCGEVIIKIYAQLYGILPCIVRISNIYGKGNLSHRFIEKTIQQAREDKDIIVYGGKDKVLNFVRVDDCIKSLVSFLWKDDEISHIASPKSYSLSSIANYIVGFLNSKSTIIEEPNRKGETLEYYPPESNSPDTLFEDIKDLCSHL